MTNTETINHHSFALAATSSESDEAPSRFQKLWYEAERLKRENTTLESELDLLVQRIRNSVGPIELEMGRAMRVQIDTLLTFNERTEMPQWQLQVLDDWIFSSMDCLQTMGLDDDALTESFAKLQAQTLGVEIDPHCGVSASDQLAAYMELQAESTNADLFANEMDETLDLQQCSEQIDAQSELDDKDNTQSNFADADLNSVIGADQTDNSELHTVFKTLFHRVARALHPDKETDPIQRKFKQSLMAQLLEARRQRDLVSVFKLYQEHVDDDTEFNAGELAELEKLLCQHIEFESQRLAEITTKTHLHDIAYTQYYSDDPNKINRAIAQKIWDMKKRKSEFEAFSAAVTSSSDLGPYLEDRLDQLRQFS